MSSSLKAQHLEKVRQQHHQGKLSDQAVEKMMMDALEQEVSQGKPDDEWIAACCDFLEEAVPASFSQEEWPDHKQTNWKKIQSAVQVEKAAAHGYNPGCNRRMKVSIIVACLVLIISSIPFSISWYQGTQSDNDQIYDLTGQKIEISDDQSATAASDDTLQEIETSDYSAVAAFLGTPPPTPHWWPSEWTLGTYYAASIDGYWSFSVYCTSSQAETVLSYSCVYTRDPSTISTGFPQDDEGETIPLENGASVYFSTNAGDTLAVWQSGNMYMSISGPVSRDVIIQIIYSVQEGEPA